MKVENKNSYKTCKDP